MHKADETSFMRGLVWILLILAAVIGISMLTSNNEGYVLIVRPPYRVELSFNLVLLLIIFSFVSLHWLLRLIQYTRKLPANARAHKEAARLKAGHAALIESLHALERDDYATAEHEASRALALGEDAGLSALVAARAAHHLNQKQKRDFYLAEAERLAPEASLARLLTQAELLLDEGLYTQVLNVTDRLQKIAPNHSSAKELAQKAARKLRNQNKI